MREPGWDEFGAASAGVARLSPTMSSRKLIALDFIKRYFARWGHSPTLGEIGAALDVSPKRAHDLVHQLATEKMIEHVAGKARGIRLIEKAEELCEADVLARLNRLGWTIGDGNRVIAPPAGEGGEPDELALPLLTGLTEKGLPELPILDHDADGVESAGTDTSGESQQE